MSSKKSLLQECDNVKEVLEETLRYKYGLDGSREFFEECETRREFLAQEIQNTLENDHDTLTINGTLLNELSALISRIERSSLGEYSWPFVEELKKIAVEICREDTLSGNNTPPKIYVLSDGGLDAYRIYPERTRPTASKKRILTIVFPRTLKHFVLLHPILGHEVGHAIWRCSKHQSMLSKIVNEELIYSGGRFQNQAATADWLYNQNPPASVTDFLTQLNIKYGITEQTFFSTLGKWDAWIEEILCDLIGLLIFGPSFAAAHCELLYALAPSGTSFWEEHPPAGCRVNMVISAAKILRFDDTSNLKDGNLKDAVTNFWRNLNSRCQPDSWYDIFSEQQLRNTLHRISDLLGKYPPASYPTQDIDLLGNLFNQISKQIPPVGFKIDSNNSTKCYSVDFRHILYAGWISNKHIPEMPFLTLNRLCEHAIMQQRSIDQFIAESKR